MAERDPPIKFETEIYDCTEPGSTHFGSSPFKESILALVEDIKWRIDRESEHAPLYGPLHQIGGKTIEPKFKLLWNGPHDGMMEVPKSDYLTHDFSPEAHYDRLLDISDRFIAAALADKTETATRLIWRSNQPCIAVNRYLMPEGLMLALQASVAWV